MEMGTRLLGNHSKNERQENVHHEFLVASEGGKGFGNAIQATFLIATFLIAATGRYKRST
jgi:hypothetical protein